MKGESVIFPPVMSVVKHFPVTRIRVTGLAAQVDEKFFSGRRFLPRAKSKHFRVAPPPVVSASFLSDRPCSRRKNVQPKQNTPHSGLLSLPHRSTSGETRGCEGVPDGVFYLSHRPSDATAHHNPPLGNASGQRQLPRGRAPRVKAVPQGPTLAAVGHLGRSADRRGV